MPARLRAHSIAIEDPACAAREITAALLADAPQRRPLHLAVVRWGAHPGLRPSPWVLDGLAQAIKARTLSSQALHLGQSGIADPITVQLTAADIPTFESDHETLAVRATGSRSSIRVPRALIGSTLCLVLPGVHHQQSPTSTTRRSSAAEPDWRGPIGTALVELVARWGGRFTREPIDRAARLVAELFAHVSVVIDGSWWAPLSSPDQGAPMLLSPERVLGLRLSSPITADATLDPRATDHWLGLQIGLPLRRRPGGGPSLIGSAAEQSWPTLPRAHTKARSPRPRVGLAGQALGALWQRNERPGPRRTALPPAVPGSLAPLWEQYQRGDHR